MSSCLDENLVLAFIEGRLRPEEREPVEEHLAACATCSELVAGAARAVRHSEVRERRAQSTMGRYRLLEPIGFGGSGIVYRAQHEDDGRIVALKTVQARSPSVLAGIRREIGALGRLRHPGIVRVVDHGVERGRPWYAMDLLEGDTLATVARRLFEDAGAARDQAAAGRLPWALTLVARLCEPLAYLHGEGLVHRDLKPENVFVSPNGQPVLLDFGLIRGAPGALGRETAEVSLPDGTPAYVAPEQLTGDPVDARADLYALGCLVHELVTGRPPFVGKTAAELLEQHLHAAPPKMGARVSGVPPELEALVQSLLAKSPRARLGHASDVAAAIARLGIADDGVTPSERHTTVYRSPLVGRDAELGQLRALADAARDGSGGGLVVVFGESGIGKTFFSTEAARGCRGMRVALGTCLPALAVLTPFRELLEMVADRCFALGTGATETLLGPRGPVLSELVPRLRELPGQDAYPPLPELSGVAARERLLDALRDTLAALAEDKPLLLLLEDLQWADDLTLHFLETLTAEYFARHRILIVGTCRSEERPALSATLTGRPFVTSMLLGRLDPSCVRSMVAEMLAWEAPEELSAAMARNAEGNPFFVSEYVRAAVTGGMLRRRDGEWLSPSSPDAWSLPHTLRELLGSRLDAVSPAGRRQCEVAAVLGREFAAEMLEEGEATEGVAELLAREILQPSDSGLLRFAHHKLQETAYERVEPARRRDLHRAAATQLEARYGTDSPVRFAALAQHWSAAGDGAHAQPYFERAGDYALRMGAYQQAAQMFERALELEPACGGQPDAQAAHRRLGLGHAHFGLGNVDRLEENALEALALLGWKRARTRRDWESLFGRELATQVAHLTLGPKTRPPDEHPPLRDAALAAGLLGQRYFYLDDAVPMAAMALLAINASEKTGAGAVPRAYTVMGGVAGIARVRGLSRRYFERARRAAVDDPGERAMALAVEIVVDGSLGDWARVQLTGAQLAALLPLLRDPLVRGVVLSTLRHVEFFGGRYDGATAHASELLELGRAARNSQHVMWAQYYLARGAIQAGRFEEARPLLREACAVLEVHKELQSEINCTGFLALTELRRGRRDEARALADVTLDHMSRSRPTGFPSLDGYSAVAEVFRELGAERPWRSARRALWRLAALYPVAVPAALLETGHARAAHGQKAAARLLFGLSRRVAVRFDMAPDREAAEEARLRA